MEADPVTEPQETEPLELRHLLQDHPVPKQPPPGARPRTVDSPSPGSRRYPSFRPGTATEAREVASLGSERRAQETRVGWKQIIVICPSIYLFLHPFTHLFMHLLIHSFIHLTNINFAFLTRQVKCP